MSFKDDFNNNKSGLKEESNSKVRLFKIEDVQVEEEKGQEYMNFTFLVDGNDRVPARQKMNYREDGTPKNMVYPEFVVEAEGKTVAASMAWDITTLAEEYDSKGYAKKKEECNVADGEITREFLIGLEFLMEIKKINPKEGKAFLKPMFSYQKQKDIEWKEQQAEQVTEETIAQPEQAELDTGTGVDPNDLPF